MKKQLAALLILVLLCGLVTGCSNGPEEQAPAESISAGPTSAPTESPTARATPTLEPLWTATSTLMPTLSPTSSATATASPAPQPTVAAEEGQEVAAAGGSSGADGAEVELPKELMISLGGNGCVCCEPPPGVELPAIEVLASGDLFVLLCVWGFPMGEEVIVELYDPTGEAVASNAFAIDEEQSGASVREVEFCSAGLPTGEWLAVAKTPTRRVEQPLQVQVFASEYPSIHTRPAPGASVSRWAGCPQVEYSVGAHLIIVGDNLPPGQDLALGIYEVEGTLVNAMWVTTDDLGHFEAPLEIDSTYDSGYYFAVILLDEESDCTDLFDQSCVKGGFTAK